VAVLLVAGVVLVAGACATDAPGATDATTTTTAVPGSAGEGSTPGSSQAPGTTVVSVPVVAPEAVEAFCALDEQLDGLTAEQLGDADLGDREAFRLAMAAFLSDNEAVIDQYLAAAPAEIEADVNVTVEQTRAAVDDPELFAELVSGTGDTRASNRVSAFIDANCPE
jgi:hypothetical protein